MLVNIILLLAVFLAFFLKRLIGFGNALILNSIFAFIKETQFTAAIDLLLVFPINIYMVWKERKGLNLNSILPILFSTLMGSTLGILLLNVVNDKALKITLGAIIIITSINLMIKKNKQNKNTLFENIFWGIVSGMLLGMYGIAALLAVHLQNIFIDKSKYRSSLCLILIIDNIYRLIMYTSNGIVNREVLFYSSYMLPIVLLAVICGSLIDKKINEKMIKDMVIALLLISGLMIFILNIF